MTCDSSGNAWLFGGNGSGAASGQWGILNDLWKWDGANWTWMSGSDAPGQAGTYGIEGTTAPDNVPGAREFAGSWVDSTGALWMLGGNGYAATTTTQGLLNDLWRWDGSAWTWLNGSDEPGAFGIYGAKGTAAPENGPGARRAVVVSKNGAASVTVFGGSGYSSNGAHYLNDLWTWDGANWTWTAGPRVTHRSAVYGTKGVAAPGNSPGARMQAGSWSDPAGGGWLYGGDGYAETDGRGMLGDLWRWDGRNWTWASGSGELHQAAVYGTKGVGAAENRPGARNAPATWRTPNGDLWLFGGQSPTGHTMNDLWRWDGTSWTWVSGSNSGGSQGSYGTKGVPTSSNEPGARLSAASWSDPQGNLWLFGGSGITPSGAGYLNDLWKWDGTNWTWMGGSDTPEQPGVYGTQGVAAPDNVPGPRVQAASWSDGSGVAWLFGGFAYEGASSGTRNDLWKWDGTNWTWVSGSSAFNQVGSYGELWVASPSNVPGARASSVGWVDGIGALWLFGGYVENHWRNDLWRWDGTAWAWAGGYQQSGLPGFYGTKGAPSPDNMPGSRYGASGWKDSNGDLWLFGGYGQDSLTRHGWLDDLWLFRPPACSPLPIVVTAPSAICAGPDSHSASIPDGGAGMTYAWTATGGTIQAGANTRSVTFSPNAGASSVVLSVAMTDAGGCPRHGTVTVTVDEALSAVAVTPATGSSVCALGTGTTLAVSLTGGGASAYQWGYRSVSGGAITPIAGQTGSTYQVAGGHFPGAGTYHVVCTATPTCGSAMVSNEVDVTVPPLTTATVSGTAAICPGSAATIEAALTGASPWNLTWSDGFVQNGVVASPATRVVNPAATTTYTVTSVSDAACAGTTSGRATITVSSKPEIPISAPTQVCPGSPGHLASVASFGEARRTPGRSPTGRSRQGREPRRSRSPRAQAETRSGSRSTSIPDPAALRSASEPSRTSRPTTGRSSGPMAETSRLSRSTRSTRASSGPERIEASSGAPTPEPPGRRSATTRAPEARPFSGSTRSLRRPCTRPVSTRPSSGRRSTTARPGLARLPERSGRQQASSETWSSFRAPLRRSTPRSMPASSGRRTGHRRGRSWATFRGRWRSPSIHWPPRLSMRRRAAARES